MSDRQGRLTPRVACIPAEERRAMLVRLNLPTATDVHVLTQQVPELEAQIERLMKERDL